MELTGFLATKPFIVIGFTIMDRVVPFIKFTKSVLIRQKFILNIQFREHGF